jgi:Bacterial Ig-like domain (group 3)/Fibronectin type III domain
MYSGGRIFIDSGGGIAYLRVRRTLSALLVALLSSLFANVVSSSATTSPSYTTTVFSDGFESGSLSAWDGVAATGSVTVTGAAAHTGSDGVRMTNASGQFDVLMKTLASPVTDSSTTFWVRIGSGGGLQTVAQARDGSSSQTMWALLYDGTRQGFYFYPYSNSGSTEIFTGASSALNNTWVKVEVQYSATTNGGAQLYINGQTQAAWGVSGDYTRGANLQKLQLWNDSTATTDFDDVLIAKPPSTAPGAPTGVHGAARDSAVDLSWTAPVSDGGSAITGYRITPYIGTTAQKPILTASAATSQTVGGLTNGTAYTFTVAAITSVGTGPDSSPSSAVTPAPATAPGAPTGVQGTPQDGAVNLNWNAPADDGRSPITAYRITPYLGGSAQTPILTTNATTSHYVSGLTNGTAYTFTVAAVNAAGTGPDSSASPAVTPAASGTKYTNAVFSDDFESGTLNAWTSVAGTGSTTATGLAAHGGSFGARMNNAAGQFDVMSETLPSSVPDSSVSFWVRVGTGGALQTVAQARDASSSLTMWGLLYDPAAQAFYFYPYSNSGSTEIFTGANTAPINTWVKVEIQYTATATGGARLYVNGQTNPSWGVSGDYTRSANLQIVQLWNDSTATTDFDDVNMATPPADNASVPGAPTAVLGTPRDSAVSLSWNAPADTGGTPIQSYEITPYVGTTAQPPIETGSSVTGRTITGLTNGTTYTFTVAAKNALGMGPASSPSGAVTPASATVPSAPTAVQGTPRDGAVGLSWTAPASDGGSSITSYTITPSINGTPQPQVVTGSSSTSAIVNGLTDGTAYTFTVAATNSAGTGSNSAASAPVTPAGATVPGAPTAVQVSPENGGADLSWTAPASDGGSSITGYKITPYIGSTAQTPISTGSSSTSYTVNGLTNGTTYTFTVAAINSVGTGSDSTASAAVTPATLNAIQIENSQPGDPNWGDVTEPPTPAAISGYGSQISVNHGQSIDFYVTTTAASVQMDVYRMGWYGGAGARLMQSLGSFPGVNQPQATPDPTTGMVSENWTKTTSLSIPSSWTTGVYLARLKASNGYGGFIFFVVRDDGGREPILFQTSSNTYQAYNVYGGTSLYNNNTNGKIFPYPHALKVSFDRPFEDGNGSGEFLEWEYPFVRWMEKNGYSAAYTTDTDTSTNVTNPITNHKAFLVVGHDEYWSKGMRDNVQAAIAAGVNVAFFAGNESYWQVRYEPNAVGVANRVIDGYKDFAECSCDGGPDPMFNVNNSVLTSLWRDPLVNRPEDGMMGVMFGGETNNSPYIVTNASNWVFTGTGWTNGTSVPGIVGYEYDHYYGDATTPAGTSVLSNTPLINTENNQHDTANSTIYTAPSGAKVFAAGTIQWSYGLDNFGGTTFVNPGVQKVTSNILGAFTGTWTPPGGSSGTSTTSVGSSANPSSGGQSVTYTATVTGTPAGTPTGNVEFLDGGNPISGCAARTLSATSPFQATCQVSYSAAGSHSITAAYLGDSNYLGSTSSALSQTVSTALPTLSVSGPATGAAGTTISASSISGNLAAGSNPTGTITFRVFGPSTTAPSTCTTGGTVIGTASVAGNGSYSPSGSFTPSQPGNYWLYASYSGDINNTAAASACPPTAKITVGIGAPALAAGGPASGTAGSAITASSIGATLSAATSTAGGTITFTVFGPQASAPTSCTSGGTTVGSASVAGNGTYNPASDFTPASTGRYWWYARYSGDANNNPSSSACGSGMASTMVTNSTSLTAGAPTSATTGSAIATSSIGSTLTGATATAGGAITFKVFGPQPTAPTNCATGGTTVGTASVNGNGVYNPNSGFTPTSAGTYWWFASYGGDANNSASNSGCGSSMISTAVTDPLSITALAPAGATAGSAISANSIVSTLRNAANGASGTITFTVFGPQSTAPSNCPSGGIQVGAPVVVNGNGAYSPTADFTPSGTGQYWWYASYSGDANDPAASSACGSGMASTTVTNAASISASAPALGTAGSAITANSVSSQLSGATSGAGGTITFTVFGPQPTAPSSCTTGGTQVGTPVAVNGSGTYSPSADFTPSSAGTYWWYASYSGDPTTSSASSGCGGGMVATTVQMASTATSVSAPTTATAGSPIAVSTIASTLTGATNGATGTITFKVFGPQSAAPASCTTGGTTVGSATVSGNNTYHPSASFTPSNAGTYWWYASYGGDANNNVSGTTCGAGMSSTVVTTATATTATAPATGTTGATIAANSIGSTLSGATAGATGTVTFTVFGPQATPPTSCTTGGTSMGTVAVSGNGTYHPSAGFNPAGAGTYWWFASYSGDADDSASSSTCGSGMASTAITNTTSTSVAGPTSGTVGVAIATASVSSTLTGTTSGAGGTITFTVFGPQASPPSSCTTGGTTVGAAAVNGGGTYNPSVGFTPSSAGTYWWYASYSGDSNNGGSNSGCGSGMISTAVQKASTTAAAAAPASAMSGSAIAASSIGATLTGATSGAGGTITFTVFGPQASPPTSCTSGGTPLGTAVTVNGSNTYHPSTSFTPSSSGTYWWYASYGGDGNNSASNSRCGGGMTSTTVYSETSVASVTATSGTSAKTTTFSVQPNTTYLLLAFRHSSTGDGITAISSSGMTPALMTSSFASVASQTYNTSNYQWAYYVTTGSTASGASSSLTVTFTKNLGSGQATILDLVRLGGNSTTAPVVTSNVGKATGTSATATANLPGAPGGADAQVVFLSSSGNLGGSAPAASPAMTNAFYSHQSAGSAGIYTRAPAQQNGSFTIPSQSWGTIALEIAHG